MVFENVIQLPNIVQFSPNSDNKTAAYSKMMLPGVKILLNKAEF
jgi:hypothetical protein